MCMLAKRSHAGGGGPPPALKSGSWDELPSPDNGAAPPFASPMRARLAAEAAASPGKLTKPPAPASGRSLMGSRPSPSRPRFSPARPTTITPDLASPAVGATWPIPCPRSASAAAALFGPGPASSLPCEPSVPHRAGRTALGAPPPDPSPNPSSRAAGGASGAPPAGARGSPDPTLPTPPPLESAPPGRSFRSQAAASSAAADPAWQCDMPAPLSERRGGPDWACMGCAVGMAAGCAGGTAGSCGAAAAIPAKMSAAQGGCRASRCNRGDSASWPASVTAPAAPAAGPDVSSALVSYAQTPCRLQSTAEGLAKGVSSVQYLSRLKMSSRLCATAHRYNKSTDFAVGWRTTVWCCVGILATLPQLRTNA